MNLRQRNKRRNNELRKRRRVMFDTETCGLAPARPLFIADPILPHLDPQIKEMLAKMELPASYKFNTDYEALSITIDAIKKLSVSNGEPVILSIQKKAPNLLSLADFGAIPENIDMTFMAYAEQKS